MGARAARAGVMLRRVDALDNLKRIVVAAGATMEQVVKMTVYVKAPEARAAVNKHWLLAFPDPASRPARHTFQNDHLPSNMLVQCDVTAVVA